MDAVKHVTNRCYHVFITSSWALKIDAVLWNIIVDLKGIVYHEAETEDVEADRLIGHVAWALPAASEAEYDNARVHSRYHVPSQYE